MDLFHHIMSVYASFFDWEMWVEVLTDPVSWGLIGSLVVLEGLLSAGNALLLALLGKHPPGKKRKKTVADGLIRAYFFWFLFIGLGMILIKFWWIKLLGAAYLAWLVIKHFFIGEGDDESNAIKKDSWMVRVFGVFWATVISVELMDLAFSVDSILAAFAVSEKVWVLLIGGMLGILMMRTVAKFFLTLIDKVPELEATAFVLIGIIALKMAASVWHIEMPHSVFFIILIIAFAVTFIIHYMNKQKAVKEQTAASKEE